MEEDPVRRLVKETVSETLLQLGFDMKDPKALQADMAPSGSLSLLHLVFYGLAFKPYWGEHD